jgi:hypothetical protein
VVLQVAAAPAAAEYPAARGDRPDPGDELGQVGGEGFGFGGVVFVTGAAGQPRLHRPRQRVAGSRPADGDLLRHGEPAGGGQFPGRRRLGLERAADGDRVGFLQREARGELVPEAEDRVDRARRVDPADWQSAPVRELRADEVPHHGGGDRQLIGVHGHGG